MCRFAATRCLFLFSICQILQLTQLADVTLDIASDGILFFFFFIFFDSQSWESKKRKLVI